MVSRLIVFLLFLSLINPVSAVQNEHEILTDGTIKVIYPSSYYQDALIMQDRLETVLSGYRDDFGIESTIPWTGILEQSSILANGYVSMPLPRTSWQISPNTSIIKPDAWYEIMAIHEGRHFAQYEALKRGGTHAAYILGGPSLMIDVNHKFIPKWMREGDAVVAETIYSDQGRGRQASFERSFRALILDNPDISYQRVVNSSYMNAYPDYYHYGYYMSGYLMNTYGEDAMRKLFNDMGRVPIPLWKVTDSLRTMSGEQIDQELVFEATRDDLYNRWSADEQRREPTGREVIYSPDQNGYVEIVDYHIDDQGLYAVTMDGTNSASGALYDVETGDQISKRTRFATLYLDVSSSYIAVVEDRRDTFGNGSHGVLALYNRENMSSRDIAEETFFGSPAISHDQELLAVAVFDRESGTTLHIYTLEGTLKKIIVPDERMFFTQLAWNLEHELVAVVNHDSQQYLAEIDTESGKIENRQELDDQFITSLYADPSSGDIYYSSDASGVEEMYAVSGDNVPDQITVSRFGVWNPLAFGHQFFAVEQQSFDRQVIVSLDLEVIREPESFRTDYVSAHYQKDRFTTSFNEPIPEDGSFESYDPIKYIGTLYSWGLMIDDLDSIGFGLRGSEPLVRHFWELSLRYDIPQDFWYTHSEWTTKGDKLAFELSTDLFHAPQSIETYGVGYQVLFNLYQERFSQHHTKVSTNRYGIMAGTTSTQTFVGTVYHDLSLGVFPPRRSLKQFELGMAQHTEMQLVPTDQQLFYRLYSRSYGYLPGPLPDDTFMITNRINYRNIRTIDSEPKALPWYVTPARGYGLDDIDDTDHLLGTASIGYHVPLFYPDLSLLNTFYFKRVRLELFGDLTYGKHGVFPSAGIELNTDFTLFNLYWLEISAGAQAVYNFTDQHMSFSVMLMGAAL
jgi:hypothetical protein